MNTCILISSRDITPADKTAILAAFDGFKDDLQFAVLEHCPPSRHRSADLASVISRLGRIRRGMHALLLRHQSLRTAVQRYVDEWAENLPKGWSLDELIQALQLEREIPDDSICIDPCGRGQHKEDLEDWVIDLGAPDPSVNADNFRRIREALKRLVGATTIKEWQTMLKVLELAEIPADEKDVVVGALHALLETETAGGAL